MWLGASGLISALANFAPDHLRRVCEAVTEGSAAAVERQQEVSDLARLFDQGHWVSALKGALEELGLPAGDPVAPLEPCTVAQRVEIRRILDQHGIQAIAPA